MFPTSLKTPNKTKPLAKGRISSPIVFSHKVNQNLSSFNLLAEIF